MNKTKPILVITAIFALIAYNVTAAEIAENNKDRPNVILFLTDDQGYSDVGYTGNPYVKTPHIDKMAANAAVFENFYALPVCSPTRAALMTGRHHMRTGVIDTQQGMSMLRPSELALSELFKDNGYQTAIVGKWHLGDNHPTRPTDRGFDYSLVHIGGMIGAPYNPLDANSYFDPILIENGVEKKFKGYCVDVFTDSAMNFMRESKNEPFFLFVSVNTPHHPLTCPDEFVQPYLEMGFSNETARYYGMITNLDYNFNRITEEVEKLGLKDNTIIIFSGDNGTSSLHTEEDLWSHGYRGAKTYVYENGIRIPMFIYGPGINAQTFEEPGHVIDFMPTIIDLCNFEKPDVDFDGLSLKPLMLGQGVLPERNLYFQWHRGRKPVKYQNFAVRSGYYKLVQPVGRGNQPYDIQEIRLELYDLKNDPFEKNNIAFAHPDIVAKLKADYEEWFRDVTDGQDYSPTRIHIGSKHQNPVVLTRQDWQGGGLFDGELGFYDIDVIEEGYYRINCRLTDVVNTAYPVTLTIGDITIHRKILYAESHCLFEKVYLPKGPAKLEAYVEMDGKKQGFRFMEIKKLSN